MFKFGVNNFRRLKAVPPIGIVPITILVGRNSSGKSSFLRALPLLRQSVQTRTSSPILWFGDLVDFGSYRGSVSDNDLREPISFLFHLDEVEVERRGRYFRYTSVMSGEHYRIQDIDVEVSIGWDSDDDVVRLKKVRVAAQMGTFTLELAKTGDVSALKLNDVSILELFQKIRLFVPPGSIFPDVIAADTKSKSELNSFVEMYYPADVRELALRLSDVVAPLVDKRLSKTNALPELCGEFLSLPVLSKDVLTSYMKGVSVRSWKKLISKFLEKDPNNTLAEIRKIHTAAQFLSMLRAVNFSLRRLIGQVLYIGPARARSERYYRYQELAVSEIDPDGKNFAMFLNSLRGSQLDELSNWIDSLFGYRLDLSRTEGHISINLVEGTSTTNVVDTGYGVSQILPVLGQIWWAANRDRDARVRPDRPAISILAIEQPELHLHPAHQVFLADALVAAPEGRRQRTHFLIETHSETLVNRLGQLVSEGKLSPQDVQIVLFEPDETDARRTNTRISTFGESGELIDWPYGFFQPS